MSSELYAIRNCVPGISCYYKENKGVVGKAIKRVSVLADNQ